MPRGWERTVGTHSFSVSAAAALYSVCVCVCSTTNSLFAKGGKYIGVYNLVTHADQTSLITNYEYKYVKSVFALSLSLSRLIPLLLLLARVYLLLDGSLSPAFSLLSARRGLTHSDR